MKWTLKLGRIAGIDLQLHWTFLILLVWIFISYMGRGGQVEDGLIGVAFILALFACVVLHELGHALTARRYGVSTRNITLLPIGGVANLERMPEEPRQELLVALAGPAVNVVLAAILYLVLQATGGMPDLDTLEEAAAPIGPRAFLYNLLAINVMLVLFNLIPAFPMDGGRVLRALLAMRYDKARATRIAAGLGQVLAIGFVFLGFFYSFWLVFIGLFIYLGASGESRLESVRAVLAHYRVGDAVMRQYTALQTDEPIRRAIEVLLDGQERDFIVLRGDTVAGVLTRDDIIRGLQTYGQDALIAMIAQDNVIELQEDADLREAYEQMLMQRASIRPVRDRMGRLIGVLNLENIQELLLLNRAQPRESL